MMPAASSVLRQQLVSTIFLVREPLRVFAIACKFGLVAEAREASRATLRIDLADAPLCEEMKYVSAYDFHRLLALKRQRAQAAQNVLSQRSRSCHLRCPKCSRNSSRRHTLAPKWWYEFERRATDELARRPLTDVVFSMRFLSDCANMGCSACGTNLLDSHVFLESTKAEIDALPDALSFTGE